MTETEAYHELCYYTLAHRDPAFIHQHVVDAFAVQQADDGTKPIAITFGQAVPKVLPCGRYSGNLNAFSNAVDAPERRLRA